ncbi:MAG TPA: hypothetical protein VFJ85_08510 [Acidimicrobiales bacterium]|nr:hypothetical protein [Acidimicrobiales bacterium]
MTSPEASTLDAARRDLARRAQEADRRGQEASLLRCLESVADMVCRIGDHPDSAHYRASKAGSLLEAAIRLHGECVAAYADPAITPELERATEQLERVADVVGAAMWSRVAAAQGVEHDSATGATPMMRLTRAFSSWVAEEAVAMGLLQCPPARHRAAPDRLDDHRRLSH